MTTLLQLGVFLYREIINFLKAHAQRQGGGGTTRGTRVKLDRAHIKSTKNNFSS